MPPGLEKPNTRVVIYRNRTKYETGKISRPRVEVPMREVANLAFKLESNSFYPLDRVIESEKDLEAKLTFRLLRLHMLKEA